MRSEADWIRRLEQRFRAGGRVRVGIGDDAAVLRGERGRDWVVTTDLMVEGAHFLGWAQPARAVGWKALARSLSDLAAMGARPRYALVALAVPATTANSWVEDFFSGVQALARPYGVKLVGGDLASAAQMVADVQALGEVPAGRAVLRRGARRGDIIFVSGTLGLSRLGLACLRHRVASVRPLLQQAVRAHFYPRPRLRLGQALARRGARAMIDVSDGLSTDLDHLCAASGVGARLYQERIPAVAVPDPVAQRLRVSGLELALDGGDDYELLFTLPKTRARRLPKELGGVKLRAIGEIVAGRGLTLVDAAGRERRLQPRGWDHFRRG